MDYISNELDILNCYITEEQKQLLKAMRIVIGNRPELNYDIKKTLEDFIKTTLSHEVPKYEQKPIIDADKANKLHKPIIDADELQKEQTPIIIVE